MLNEIATPGEIPEYTERYCRRAFFEETLGELVPSHEWTDAPVVLGLDWGHTNPIAPLALGREVEIRPDDRTVVVR